MPPRRASVPAAAAKPKPRKSRPDAGRRILTTQALPQVKRSCGGLHPICWRCSYRLRVGEPYYTRPGRAHRKYYHVSCWERVSDSAGGGAGGRSDDLAD